MSSDQPDEFSPHLITDYRGILALEPVAEGEKVEIAFDPRQLTEADIRRITLQHIQPVATGMQRMVLRLDGEACEAAAGKLERRIEQVPGVRRATATYIGRVLCLTFDSAVLGETGVMAGVRAAGAKVESLEADAEKERMTLGGRVLAGDLNEEISVILGLGFLIGAFFTKSSGLYLGAYVFCGQNGVRSALASLKEKTLDVDLLMVLAALGAAVVGSPFEGALLLFLFSFSNVLQRYALERTQRAIESLLTLRPEKALKKRGNVTELVPVNTLVPGDVVIVRPGELLPVDGVVAEGSSSLDESSLTGESMPVAKALGATVFAGTMNQTGAIEIRVTRKSEDSTLSKMVRLVAEAQAEKSGAQRFLEHAEQSYAAGVIGLTILVFLVPWLVAHETFATAFYRAMTVMVVASPCALVISTPATVLSAIGGAARRGILIKGGAHLEQAAKVTIVTIDKTGTLTTGRPTVTDIVLNDRIHPLGNERPPLEVTRLLAICAALESKSEHPLAAAVVSGAKSLRLELPVATAFQSTPGKGAEANIEGRRYIVGSERLFQEVQATGSDVFLASARSLQENGKSCIWMGERRENGVVICAVFALADTLRPEARQLTRQLHALGIQKVVMLTGDQKTVAAAIAAEAGIDEFRAELLPEDKVTAIRELKKEGIVMMIGDGVNDAPALATAHLGVAMGAAGTDVAMETADVVLMGDKLENIATLLGTARQARRVLVQNLGFAGGIIVILLVAALGFRLPLPLGVIGHEGSTVLVCLNGLRLLLYRPKTF